MEMKLSKAFVVGLVVAATLCCTASGRTLSSDAPVAVEYKKLDEFDGIELRQYPAGRWVRVKAATHDFAYTLDQTYEALMRYFDGDNFGRVQVQSTTPMLISFNLWDKSAQRYGYFYVPMENPPAPKRHVDLQEVGERFVYAASYNTTTDFNAICKVASRTLVNLVLDEEPVQGSCNGEQVFLAFYDYPPGSGQNRPNEVLIIRADDTPIGDQGTFLTTSSYPFQ